MSECELDRGFKLDLNTCEEDIERETGRGPLQAETRLCVCDAFKKYLAREEGEYVPDTRTEQSAMKKLVRIRKKMELGPLHFETPEEEKKNLKEVKKYFYDTYSDQVAAAKFEKYERGVRMEKAKHAGHILDDIIRKRRMGQKHKKKKSKKKKRDRKKQSNNNNKKESKKKKSGRKGKTLRRKR